MTLAIGPNDKIAGYPALKIRHLLREFRMAGGYVSHYLTAKVLKIDLADAKALTNQLHSFGYLVLAPGKFRRSDVRTFTLTDKGMALVNASAAPRITRKTAQKSVDEFMKRVADINANDDLPYRVHAVVLYGSILRDNETLGDVDLAFELKRRTDDNEEFDRLCAARRDLRASFGNMIEYHGWPQFEIWRMLRARKRSISLHALAELETMAKKGPVPYRVLYGNKAEIDARLHQCGAGRERSRATGSDDTH